MPASRQSKATGAEYISQDICYIDLVSSEDEQQLLPPHKKPRYSFEANKDSSFRSRATSISSQATIPQPLTPTTSGLQLQECAVLNTAASEEAVVKAAALLLDPETFLGMTDGQYQALSPGDHMWWLSDKGELQLACCRHQSDSACSHESSNSVLISIVWNPSGKSYPQRCFQSSQTRLQRHFFQGQTVEWRHDGILEQVSSISAVLQMCLLTAGLRRQVAACFNGLTKF